MVKDEGYPSFISSLWLGSPLPEPWGMDSTAKTFPSSPEKWGRVEQWFSELGFSEFWDAVLKTINIGLPIGFFQERILRKQVPLTTVISKKIIQHPELIRVISRIQGWFFKLNTLCFVKNFLPWNFVLVFYLRPLRPFWWPAPPKGQCKSKFPEPRDEFLLLPLSPRS